MSPVIHSLHIYPIKSCQGIQYDSVELTDTGFKYDRHWMLVNKQGEFLSQRKFPQMARVQTVITEHSLVISTPDVKEHLEIPLFSNSTTQIPVNIWNDRCSANIVSLQASQWFSDCLGIQCDLVYLAETEHRLVDPDYATNKQRVGFADGFPLLIVSRSTSDLLSEKLNENININRFRANIVIGGCEAHAEDSWSSITVNNIDIQLAKLCSRCVIPSIDQQSASKHDSLLKTLASYRRHDGKIYVGQNGLHLSNGVISVGQAISVSKK